MLAQMAHPGKSVTKQNINESECVLQRLPVLLTWEHEEDLYQVATEAEHLVDKHRVWLSLDWAYWGC